MDFYVVLFYMLACGIPVLGSITTLLFILDGKKAKKEGRRRRLIFTVLFIFGVILLALYLVGALLSLLIMIDIAMNGM